MAIDVIAEFLARYEREQDFYIRVSEAVGRRTERLLRIANIRAITTWRAKRIDALSEKLRLRNVSRHSEGTSQYLSIEEIYADIPDLAGARIALYFPSDRSKVTSLIAEHFAVVSSKIFEPGAQVRPGKRFPGYIAQHYRVKLKTNDLSDDEKRYSSSVCEIQVASVLMHAWAEVEHDLEYKQLSGNVSPTESALLDQINGLVLSGEIALEQLQNALSMRVAEASAELRDHYDLANWLLAAEEDARRMEPLLPRRQVGRADFAFNVLQELGKVKGHDLVSERRELVERLLDLDENEMLASVLIDVVVDNDPKAAQAVERARALTLSVDHQFSFGPRHQVDASSILQKIFAEWDTIKDVTSILYTLLLQRSPHHRTSKNLLKQLPISDELVEHLLNLGDIRNQLTHNVGMSIPETQLEVVASAMARLANQLLQELGPQLVSKYHNVASLAIIDQDAERIIVWCSRLVSAGKPTRFRLRMNETTYWSVAAIYILSDGLWGYRRLLSYEPIESISGPAILTFAPPQFVIKDALERPDRAWILEITDAEGRNVSTMKLEGTVRLRIRSSRKQRGE